MAIAYHEALKILQNAAREVVSELPLGTETLETKSALHRIASQDVFTTLHTPSADTSAMDGYAIPSAATEEARPDNPVTLRVRGIVAAGDSTIRSDKGNCDAIEGVGCSKFTPCVEIMTGARFPSPVEENGVKWDFDACARVEDVHSLPSSCPDQCQLIQIFKPVKLHANRRFAGEDFAERDMVVEKGEALQAQHIMALASLGIARVNVFRKVRVAILSTGNEIVPFDGQATKFEVRDANGPFLETALEGLYTEVCNLGEIPDDPQTFIRVLGTKLSREDFDMVITTGGVSCGRYDFVEEALAGLKGSSKFHRVAIRPGHPILFGTVPVARRPCAFFGLPGNPIACVVCFRFFVVPYLRFLHNLQHEATLRYRVYPAEPLGALQGHISAAEAFLPPSHLQTFRLGRWIEDSEGRCVRLVAKQGSHRIQPLLKADCWVIIPAHSFEHKDGVVLCTMPLHASATGKERDGNCTT